MVVLFQEAGRGRRERNGIHLDIHCWKYKGRENLAYIIWTVIMKYR